MDARIEDKLTCHAWNADCSMLAVCPNNNTVSIFKVPASPDGPHEPSPALPNEPAPTCPCCHPVTEPAVTTAMNAVAPRREKIGC